MNEAEKLLNEVLNQGWHQQLSSLVETDWVIPIELKDKIEKYFRKKIPTDEYLNGVPI